MNSDALLEKIFNRKALSTVKSSEKHKALMATIDSFKWDKSKNERNREMFLKRYGQQKKLVSFKDISKEYGVSIERVRQLHEKFLRRLRWRSNVKNFKNFVEPIEGERT